MNKKPAPYNNSDVQYKQKKIRFCSYTHPVTASNNIKVKYSSFDFCVVFLEIFPIIGKKILLVEHVLKKKYGKQKI